ncbi:chlorophyllase-2, chloroplastic [Canna indica]|uniref:chlorophyllase n=1 Tax=Canna indica TaxID=4628 RepID=A0AAQ3JXB0_9LILI|nr:chlorophyllase-2, chloroplastic [Canna indica]
MSMSPVSVFEHGGHTVSVVSLEPDSTVRSSPLPPPKPLLLAAPSEEGDYPMLVFLHGYLLRNSFYSQLFQHVASHGFIVIAPQLYSVAGPDSGEEIKSAAAVVDWLTEGLNHVLPGQVRPNTSKLAIGGHSRGGKVAFAIALGHAKTSLKFSALMGIDPVDGMDKGKQTYPPILTYVPHSLDLGMAALVIGSGLGELKKNPLFPPCAPKGVSHQDFFDECCAPACHFVARDYGHLDMLDDETKGVRGKATYCLCKNGGSRKPMRAFVGGAMVAFMKAYLEGDSGFLMGIRDDPQISPVELSVVNFLEPKITEVSQRV